jgi:hypothetical protein
MQKERNFMETGFSERIEQLILSPNFSWYYTSSTNYDDGSEDNYFIDNNTIETPQFIHTVVGLENGINSDVYYELLPLFNYYGITISNIKRCKINLLCKNYSYPKDCYQTPHQDDINCKTLLYYVNDSDGDTLFFDAKYGDIIERVTPERGSAILFDSNEWHASSPPKIHNSRVVINVVFD